jgi:hypothetical protein
MPDLSPVDETEVVVGYFSGKERLDGAARYLPGASVDVTPLLSL